jgi:hypothetical protein
VRLGAPGLAAYVWFAQGTGAINPATGHGAPDAREYDFDVAYTFPGGPVKGLQIRGALRWSTSRGRPASWPTSA